MSAIRRGFGRKTCLGGLALFLVGTALIGVSLYPIVSGRGKIYIFAALAGPALLVAGLYQLQASVHTPICKQCEHELRVADVSTKGDIGSVLNLGPLTETKLRTLELVEEDFFPQLRLRFQFCPVCVTVGSLQGTLRTDKQQPQNKLTEQELTGPIVRQLKDQFLL
jgi:hypothetical protein